MLYIFKKSCLLVITCFLAKMSVAQEMEPRSYASVPKKMNALAVVSGISHGNVLLDASLPIKNLDITIYSAGVGYVRTFGIGNKLCRVQATLPFAALSGNAQINGVDTAATRAGFGDARLRFGINLTGSPAMDKKHFANYTQKTIVGMSFVVALPTGNYKPEKLVNIGSNRWGFKPELGISKRFKRVYAEAYAGIWFFTVNNSYTGKKILKQDPMPSFQAHVCYYFKNRMWVSADGAWFWGGQTSVNGNPNGRSFDNWRAGGVWSFPIARGHSLKLQFHTGAFASRGYNYKTVSLAYQYIFF